MKHACPWENNVLCITPCPNPNWSELKKLELKNNNITDPPNPQYQSTSTTNTDETVLAPQLNETLVPSKTEEQKEDNIQTVVQMIPREM